MKAKIITTIVSYVDIETMTPEHEVDIESEDSLPENVVLLVALGACRSAAKTLGTATNQTEESDTHE